MLKVHKNTWRSSCRRKTVHLPCSDMDRTFVVVNKTNNTGKKYPRKAGTPSKEPL